MRRFPHTPRIAWATDLHLESASYGAEEEFLSAVRAAAPDVLLLGGDTAVADHIEMWLRRMERELPCPVYFVLGNHDYYGGSIQGVREEMRRLSASSWRLGWLPAMGAVDLGNGIALVGHGGWGDGRHGDYEASSGVITERPEVREAMERDYASEEQRREAVKEAARICQIMGFPHMKDFGRIRELFGLSKSERLERLHSLGDEAAASMSSSLEAALSQDPEDVVVLTHVPPFLGAAWHNGGTSDAYHTPFFVCRALGDVLQAAAAAQPQVRFTVLTGHTHGTGVHRAEPNLIVYTGGAEYRRPALQGLVHELIG